MSSEIIVDRYKQVGAANRSTWGSLHSDEQLGAPWFAMSMQARVVDYLSIDSGPPRSSGPFWSEGDSTIVNPAAMIPRLGYFMPLGERQMMVVKSTNGDLTYYVILGEDEMAD